VSSDAVMINALVPTARASGSSNHAASEPGWV
jgi:hypothetical protein